MAQLGFPLCLVLSRLDYQSEVKVAQSRLTLCDPVPEYLLLSLGLGGMQL